jgi:GntR family transcriptional repressor for pyruvate dehydrogenase complex
MKAAATQFRSVIMAKEDGDFIGDEREVIQVLGVSRTTLRQIARLLEREGLLSVRRGSSGGYFARLPSPLSVEVAVVDYLEILNVHTEELSAMASKLLELSAIAQGDQELGVLAARRSRDLWRTVSQF